MTQIGYLVHDLTDPAVQRRLAMLQAGGATVKLAGLSRGTVTIPDALDLGSSADGKLATRALRVGGIVMGQRARLWAHLGAPDVLIARNAEMLAVAVSLLPGFARRPRLIYECLDIHRLLTAPSLAGKALRALEQRLAPHVDLVMTSSPAFVTHHLGAVFGDRIMIVENRVLDLAEGAVDLRQIPPRAGPPWKIGWFGALRCKTSLAVLTEAARLAAGQLEVVIRGRPSPAIFPDLPGQVARLPHVRYEGPYDAAQLGPLYGQVHFAWCVDLYEAGANSEWLLPNRLYESIHNGCVPIARLGCEAGRFLVRHDIGVTLAGTSPPAVLRWLETLDVPAYRDLLRRQHRLPRHFWRADRADCAALVRALAGDPSLPAERRVVP
ncbi:MAG: glycosyl transferase family 1 [Gemmobacter sp.]|nr:glycosyl transferase family 1 [Gemmobacter sp.]